MKLSQNSLRELNTCHMDLVLLFKEVIDITPLDFTIVQGARTIEQARENFHLGFSNLNPDKGQFSKHIIGNFSIEYKDKIYAINRDRAIAIDICPYQKALKWNDEPAFYVIAGIVLATAKKLGITIRYGGGWDLHKGINHLNLKGELKDLGHFELV